MTFELWPPSPTRPGASLCEGGPRTSLTWCPSPPCHPWQRYRPATGTARPPSHHLLLLLLLLVCRWRRGVSISLWPVYVRLQAFLNPLLHPLAITDIGIEWDSLILFLLSLFSFQSSPVSFPPSFCVDQPCSFSSFFYCYLTFFISVPMFSPLLYILFLLSPLSSPLSSLLPSLLLLLLLLFLPPLILFPSTLSSPFSFLLSVCKRFRYLLNFYLYSIWSHTFLDAINDVCMSAFNGHWH